MDPLSIIASVAGLLTAAVTASKETISVINDIRDAPQDISLLGQEMNNLNLLLESTRQRTDNNKLREEDAMLAQTVNDCTVQCTVFMKALTEKLRPYSAGGLMSRGLFKRMGFAMDKDEIKELTEKLRDSKASLQFAITILGYYMTAKIREDVGSARSDILLAISRTQAMLLDQHEFRDVESAAKLKQLGQRLDSDVTSIYDSSTTVPRVFDQPSRGFSDEIAPPSTLLEAVLAGNAAKVLELLSKGSRVSERSNTGSTALHYCAQYNDRDIAEILIERGALVDTENNERMTALDVCLREDSCDVAQLLIEKDCSVSTITEDSWISLMSGKGAKSSSRWHPVLKALAGLDHESRDVPQLLHRAIMREDSVLLEALLDLGFAPNIADKNYTPLHQAIISGREKDAQLLISKGANVNAFLPHKADRPTGPEPRYQILSKLKERGYTPLLLAAVIARKLPIVKLLLRRKADPNFLFPGGDVVLNIVCATEYLDIATELVKGGANVNFQNRNDGTSALFWAVSCGNTRLVKLLLERGADVNMQTLPDMSWALYTPLHAAVGTGRAEEAVMLIKGGADLRIKNGGSLTHMDMAVKLEKHAMIQLLSAH